MGSQNTRDYAPNPLPATATPGDTNWHVVASDGSVYATVAALIAAGKRPYPGLIKGAKILSCLIRSLTSAGAAGSGVLFKRDTATTPSTVGDADNEVGGSDQQISLACPFHLIWIKCIAGSDSVKLDGRY